MRMPWILLALGPALATADEIDTFIQTQMERQHFPGAVVLIKQHGKIIKSATYGFSDLEAKKKTRLDQQFDMGSIGKTMTAVMAAQLVDEGKMNWDQKIRDFVPDVPAAWGDIRLRHLVTHTAGTPEYALIPGIGLNDSPTTAEWTRLVYEAKSENEPGEVFQYSNTNFKLLALAIEKASGKSFYENLQKRILEPAKIKSLGFRGRDKLAKRTKGYFWQDNAYIDAGPGGISPVPGDGGAFISAPDLMNYATALQNGKLIKLETLATLQSPFVLNNGRKSQYGMGWFIRKVEGNPMISHGGNSVGFSGSLAIFPKQDLTVVFLCNVYPVGGDEVALNLARILAPELRPQKLANAKSDPNPVRTQSTLAGLHALAAANANFDGFHADMKKRLSTGRGQMIMGAFAAFKDLKELQFIDERREEPDAVARYRAQVGANSWILEVTIDKNGKIYSIGRSLDPGQP